MEPDRCPSHSPVADRASVGWVGKRDLQLVNPATTCCPDCPILIPPSRRWGGAFPFTGPLAPTQDLPLWSVSLIFTFGRFIHCYSLESHHSKCFYFPRPPPSCCDSISHVLRKHCWMALQDVVISPSETPPSW